MTWERLWPLLLEGTVETLYMTCASALFAYVIGLPLGVLLVITRKDGIKPAPTFNAILGTVINFLRSIPFIILLVMLIPVTRAVVGVGTGTEEAIIFPLVISAFPYVARMVEGSLEEMDHGVIEAAQSMGSTNWQIITKVMLPESVPSLINGAAISVTTILAYTAMASAAGGGGLGANAITLGQNNNDDLVKYSCSLLLVVLVQIITVFGTRFTRGLDHRKH